MAADGTTSNSSGTPVPAGVQAPPPVQPDPASLKPKIRELLEVLGGAIAIWFTGTVLGPILADITGHSAFYFIGGLSGMVAMVWLFFRSIWMLRKFGGYTGPIGAGSWFGAVGILLMSMFGFLVAMVLGATFMRGRQVRRRFKVMLPPVGQGDDWAHLELQPSSNSSSRVGRWPTSGARTDAPNTPRSPHSLG
jgi:hypothetical protein